jgi:serine/threonine protein kinase
MPIAAGSRLGAYEVLAPLGAGGMGEVYRARDSRLGRDVAIKVLPTAFAADPDRLARFEQEARAAASLNHPNILAVHDLGQHNGAPFIVTELLDGMSLREALNGGALPARKAIDYGVAVALGLAAAHDKGIVHRDMKPDNVFITADGRVKILDFGVAKLTQPEVAPSGMTVMPTTPGFGAAPQTLSGMVVGTIGYMSPEQVRGGIADPRSDIFSLGVLLHEMLSGRRTFSGDTAADVMSGILREDPPDLSAEHHIPPALARIVSRCLEKGPAARFQSARDLAFALEGLTASTSSASLASSETPPSRNRVVALPAAGLAAVILALLAAGAAWILKPQPATSSDEPIARLSIALPDGDQIFSPDTPSLDISTDGKYVAYAAVHHGIPTLMLRARDGVTSQALPGTDGAVSPFFSPDGKSVGFFARGRLRTIGIASSETKDLADALNARGGWWAEDGFIYYAPGNGDGIWKVHSNGGTPSAVTTLDRSKGEISHRWPQVLPGGKAMLMSAWTGPARDNRLIQVVRLGNGQRETVATGDSGRYSSSGHVLFSRLDALMAVPFDLDRLAPSGQAFKTVDTARVGGEGASFAVSDRGDLVNLPGDPHRMDTRIVWVDRSGHTEPVQVPVQDIANTVLSPDGRRAAFNVHGSTNEIGIVEFERGVVTLLTTNTNGSQAPVWSPDGQRVAYRGTRKGFRNVWVKSVDGTSEEQQLTHGEGVHTPTSWSPDGKNLLYYDATTTSSGWDLWVVSVADARAQPLVAAPLRQSAAQWSPDGHWIAYGSDESGRDEVYVLPFPLTGQRWRVSTDGGSEPAWSHDGRELFYRGGGKVWAVDVRTSPAFSVGSPRALFADTFTLSPNATTGYSVTKGARFLFAQPIQPDPPITHIQMVVNWFSELRRAATSTK